jgi:transposase
MARSSALLTEAQWQKIAPLLPKPPKQRKSGRPWIQNRRVLEAILWILRSGARGTHARPKFHAHVISKLPTIANMQTGAA